MLTINYYLQGGGGVSMRRSHRDKDDATKKKVKKIDASRRTPSGSLSGSVQRSASLQRSGSLQRSRRSLSESLGGERTSTPQSLRSVARSSSFQTPETANHFVEQRMQLKQRETDLRTREEQMSTKLSEAATKEANWIQLTQDMRQEYIIAMKQWDEMSLSVNKTQEELGKVKRQEIADLTSKLEDERVRLREREQELSQHRIAAAGVESQLKSIRLANEDTNSENDRLRMEVTNLKNIISQRDKDVETIRRGDELEFNSQLSNFNKQISVLTENISHKEEERQHQVERYINIKKRYKAKRKQFEELKQINTEQADEITRLKVLKQSLEITKTHHVEMLKQTSVDHQNEVEHMQESILRLSQQFQLVHKDNVSSLNGTSRRRVHSASRPMSRWSSSSPPSQIVPFCSAVRGTSAPLALLDNGPNQYSYSRDTPRISHSFRWIPPPNTKAVLFDKKGHVVLPAALGQRTYAQRNPPVSAPPPKSPSKSTSKRSASVDTNETYGAMPLHDEKNESSASNKKNGTDNNNTNNNSTNINSSSAVLEVPPPIDAKITEQHKALHSAVAEAKNDVEKTIPQRLPEVKEKHAIIITPQHSSGLRSPSGHRPQRSASNASSHGSAAPPSPADSPNLLTTLSFRTKESSPETHDDGRSDYSSTHTIFSSEMYSHTSPSRTVATTQCSDASHIFNELSSSVSDDDGSSSLHFNQL